MKNEKLNKILTDFLKTKKLNEKDIFKFSHNFINRKIFYLLRRDYIKRHGAYLNAENEILYKNNHERNETDK